MKPILFLPVGLPGCGKSSLASDMWQAGCFSRDAIVSPDDFRRRLTGRTSDQSANSAVFRICYEIVQFRLSRSLLVYFDATNVSKSARKPLEDMAGLFGADIVSILFEDHAEARRRNAKPIRTDLGLRVPDNVMDNMEKKYDTNVHGHVFRMPNDLSDVLQLKQRPLTTSLY